MLSILLETIEHIVLILFYLIWGPIRASLPYSLLLKKSVENEIVVITGAASGVGRLLSIRFAHRGSKLALLDLNLDGLEETKEIIHGKKPHCLIRTYRCDLNDRSDVYRAMDQIKVDLGDADILVNNAGIVTGKKMFQCPDDLMVKTMNVNTLAHFWTIKSVLPSMLDRNHGHIVTMASAGGLTGTAGLVDYCASKFAVVGLTESLSSELRSLGKNGIHTTTICPFYINTGMFHGATTRFPWVMPVLEPEYVADKIMEAISTNQEILAIPRALYLSCFLKSILPTQAYYRIVDFWGITQGMEAFKGRILQNGE